MRLTIAVPSAHVADANYLAMALGYSTSDQFTYRYLSWQDTAGNLYAAASFDARPEWMIGAQSALVRPVWDDKEEGYTVNMAGADRAQALLYVVGFDVDGQPADGLANPLRITVMPGEDALAAMAAMGLSRASDALI